MKTIAQHVDKKYIGLQYLYWMMFCTVYGFASVFLLSHGIGNGIIGLTLATANIASIFLQTFISKYVIDYSGVSLKRLLTVIACLLMLLYLVLMVFSGIPIITVVLYGACAALIQSFQPFVNALGFDYANSGYAVNFGLARGAGSLAYAMTSFMIGRLLISATVDVIPIIALITAVFILILLTLSPKDAISKSGAIKQSVSDASFFLRNHGYPVFLAATAFLFVFHSVISTYMMQILTHVGGAEGDVGNALTIAALCEIPAMFFFQKLLKIRSNRFWLIVASAFFVIRGVSIYASYSVETIILSQMLQAFSFALFIPSASYMVNEKLLPLDRIYGQTLLSIAMTVGNVLGNVAGGTLLDTFGVPSLLIVSVACASIGFGLTVYYFKITSRNSQPATI